MILGGRYIDLAATGVNILAALWAGGSLMLGAWIGPYWRRRAADQAVLRSYARLDDYGRPVARG
jgi:hypothetical protein